MNASEFLYNIVYVYVCKMGEKFGGCWWSVSLLDQKVNDSMDSSFNKI